MNDALQNLLRKVQRLHRRHAVLRSLAVAATVFAAAFLAALVLDATFGLPPGGLLLLSGVLAVLLLGSAVWLVRTWRRTAFEPRRIARLLEQRLEIADSRFINAIDLAPPPTAPHPPGAAAQAAEQRQRDDQARRVSEDLRRLAVEQGETAARDVPIHRAVDRRPTRQALATLAIVLGVLLLTGLIAPRLYTMVVPRLLSPTGDHPPFTLLNFDVTTDPEQVHHGYDARIEAAITGPTQPSRAAVVFTDTEPPERVPMLRSGDGRFTLPVESVTDSRRFYIDTADGRSRTRDLPVLPTPTFRAVTVEYEYPEYTNWPPESRSLDERGIEALHGTRVRLTVSSNLPLDHGRWQISDGDVVTLTPDADDPTTASGALTVERSGSFRLSLVGDDGHESLDALEGPIEALADEAPYVQIVDPDLRLLAPPNWTVPIRALARDDVAVDRMVLQRSLNRGSTEREPLDLEPRQAGRAAEASRTLSLSAMGAEEGDTVTGFVTAYDNHPQPRSADSEIFTIRVVSEEEYRELARREYRAEHIADEMQQLMARYDELNDERQAMLDELTQLREEVAAEEEGATAEQRERLEQLKRQIEAYADQLDLLAEAMRRRAEQYDLYTFEEPYREMLEQMADELSQHAQAARERAQPLPNGAPSDLDAALAELSRQQEQAEGHREQIELTERQLRQLAAAQRLQAEAQRIMTITEKQRDISDRLNPYARLGRLEGAEVTRARRIGGEQQELREKLGGVVGRLEAAAGEARQLLPTMAGSAHQLVEDIRELAIKPDQQFAAELALDGVGGNAWARADSAARKLESLLSACESLADGGAGFDEMDNPLSLSEPQVAQCMSEMASAEAPDGPPGDGEGGGPGAAGARGDATGGEGARGPGSPLDGFTAAPPSAAAGAPSASAGPFDRETDGFGIAGEGSSVAQDRPDRAEVLEVDSADRRRSAPPHAAGVPLQFREMTQQYFRRLAEDQP